MPRPQQVEEAPTLKRRHTAVDDSPETEEKDQSLDSRELSVASPQQVEASPTLKQRRTAVDELPVTVEKDPSLVSEELVGMTGSTTKQSDALPTENVIKPLETDILCGRGRKIYDHPGNTAFRTLIKSVLEFYWTGATMEQKHKVTKRIVAMMRSQNRRFLKVQNEKWFDIGDGRATEMVKQRFRDLKGSLSPNLLALAAINSRGIMKRSLPWEQLGGQPTLCPPSAFLPPNGSSLAPVVVAPGLKTNDIPGLSSFTNPATMNGTSGDPTVLDADASKQPSGKAGSTSNQHVVPPGLCSPAACALPNMQSHSNAPSGSSFADDETSNKFKALMIRRKAKKCYNAASSPRSKSKYKSVYQGLCGQELLFMNVAADTDIPPNSQDVDAWGDAVEEVVKFTCRSDTD